MGTSPQARHGNVVDMLRSFGRVPVHMSAVFPEAPDSHIVPGMCCAVIKCCEDGDTNCN